MAVGVRVLLSIAVAILALIGAELAGAEEQAADVRVPFRIIDDPSAATTVTVKKGDHLWKIARRHLEVVVGQRLSTSQIARYWRSVVELNLGRLRSGDPDLIYPGEVIALPEDPISGPP